MKSFEKLLLENKAWAKEMVDANPNFFADLASIQTLELLADLSDETVITKLKQVKGIGEWTADIYLMMAMRRVDRFPHGDVALIKMLTLIKPGAAPEDIETITATWKPYRTIAAYLLWHAYLSKRKKKEKVAQ